jgi:hypothetical protein
VHAVDVEDEIGAVGCRRRLESGGGLPDEYTVQEQDGCPGREFVGFWSVQGVATASRPSGALTRAQTWVAPVG